MRVWLSLLPALIASASGAASTTTTPCTGALDCNARECLDCSCVNHECACADGWSGDGCATPFCNNRTDGCSGHGDCAVALRNTNPIYKYK